MITKTKEMFRSSPIRSAPEQGVDRSKNAIYGCVVMQLGDILDDRPYTVDDDTLDQVVKMGNKSRNGLKSRFTHPNLSNDGLGSHLGRFKSFRRDGDRVKADLFIADTAFNSPRGDIGNYVLDLAEEDPKAFGVSLATMFDEQAMEAARPDNKESGDGEQKRTPLRFKSIHSCDFVDQPAAVRDGLFADRLSESTLVDYATHIMDRFFAGANIDHVRGRVDDFLIKYYRGEQNMSEIIDETAEEQVESTTHVEVSVVVDTTTEEAEAEHSTEVTTEEELPVEVEATPEQEEEEEAPQELATSEDHQRFIKQFGTQGAVWFLEKKSFEECLQLQVSALRDALTELSAENEDLQNKLTCALNATGEIDPLSAEPENLKARKIATKVQDAKSKGVRESTAVWAATMYGD